MDIDKLAQQFKSEKELRAYANSQYSVIISLNQKIQEKEKEIEHLKKMLSNSTPLLDSSSGSLEIYKDMPDELIVCVTQIKLLKDKAVNNDELTYEETKKLDIYTKLLIQLRSGKPKDQGTYKDLTDEELALVLVKNE